jgi:hypothetical protein
MKAENIIATLAGRALVEIEVAMVFAVSWKPLIKSKDSARTTTMVIWTIIGSNILTPLKNFA